MSKVVRVNTRISKTLNDWLDKRSFDTGYSKSTLVMLAIENYQQQVDVIDKMQDISVIYKEIQEIKEKLDK